MSNAELESIRQRWTRILSGLRRRMRWHQAAEAVALLLAGVVLVVLLTGLIDYRFELSTTVRRLVLLVSGGVLAYSAWRRLLLPLLARLELVDVAALVDRSITARQAVTTGVPQRPGRLTASAARVLDPETQPSPLLQRAIAQSDAELQSFPMDQALDRRHLGKSLLGTVATLAVPIAIALAVPTASRVWAARWIGGDDVGYPRNTAIEVVGLKNNVLQVPRGEPARITVKVSDVEESTQVVWLRLSPAEGDRITSALDAYGQTGEAEDSTTSEFRGDLPPLANTTTASVWGGDARPIQFQIEPVDRPQIVEMTLTAKHPAEEQVREFDMLTSSDVRLLRDTEVKLTVVSSCTVEVEYETSAQVESVHTCPTTYELTWTHTEPTAIRISTQSPDTGLESFPRTVPIGLLPDRPPSVTLRHSGVRLRLTPIATIPLSVTARDDFGVAKVTVQADVVRMKVTALDDLEKNDREVDEAEAKPADSNSKEDEETPEASTDTETKEGATESAEPSDDERESSTSEESKADDSNTKPLPQGTGPIVLFGGETIDSATASDAASVEPRVDREHRLDLTPLQLRPGDVVNITATATDDAYGGAQERKSRTITFRVVKDVDLFREIKLRLQQLRSRLRKATDTADEFRLTIAKAELPKDASSLGREYQVSRREIGTISQQIEQTSTELQLNQLGGENSQEIIEQLRRGVVDPLARLQAGAMDRQRVTLGELSKTTGQQSEENRNEAVIRHEEIVASLNEVLKNMNQWDSFIDVVNQLNTTIRKQQDVDDGIHKLQGSPKEATPEAADPSNKKPKTNAADDIFDN